MERLSDRKKFLIFVNIMAAGVSTSMLATAMSTALPAVIEFYDVSLSTGQWITSGYSLAMAIVMPLSAFLLKRIPTKRLYITAILGFIFGEILSIIAPTFGVMMTGRVLQAFGNGMLVAMGQVIILTIYGKEKKGTMMGWYGLATTAAPVIAPTIGGILVETVGWKYIFIFTLAIMLVALAAAVVNFENVLSLQDISFDIYSFILSVFAFGGITLGAGNISTYGIISVPAGIPFAVGVFTGILFVLRQLGLDKAFLDVRILANRNYTLAVVSSMILYLIMMAGSTLVPLYVQSVLGKSAIVSSIVTLPGSVATAVVSPFAGRIYDKIGIKKLFVTGTVFLLISNIGMFFVTLSTPLFAAAFYNVIRSVSIGCLMMPLLTWGAAQVRKDKVPDASSLLTSLRTVSGSIGTAVFVGIMSAVGTASAAAYGESASMHGMNVTFLCMAGATLVQLAIAVFGVRKE